MSQGTFFRFAKLRGAASIGALFLVGCPAPPPPPPIRVEPPPQEPVEAPPPPLAAAEWRVTKGGTLVGPELADGTLVLLGGRRVLVAKDGTAKGEATPSPEGLSGLTEVVVEGGSRKLVAFSDHALYRLDEPLGEPKVLARTDGEIWKISPGPGVVAVWDFDSDVPRFIDVETGQLAAPQTLPAVPANSIAFKNPKEGAAVFEAVGLATTTDGGATWKPVTSGAKGDVLRVIDLKLRGDTIFASLGYGRGLAPVDAAAGALGLSVEEQVPSDEAPIIKWVRRTERDPLAEAAQSGVLMPSGEALVTAGGLLARVHMKTGLISDLVDISGEDPQACYLARAGDAAWLGCSMPRSESGDDYYDPFGVYKISLGGGKIAPDRPVLKRSGDAELRTSPSGGVMLLGPCTEDAPPDELCVRQPDGKWVGVHPSMDPYERGAGPLADGRVAYLRGIYEGEDPPEDVAPKVRDGASEDEEQPQDEEAAPLRRSAWVVAADASGKEQTIATISLPPDVYDLAVRGFVQEDSDKRLHAVLFSGDMGPSVLIAPPGKTPVELQKVPGAGGIKLVGNFGVAFGSGKLQGSTDGGATWAELRAPRRVLDLVSGSDGGDDGYYASYYDDYFTVSDAGVRVEQFVRLGWGAEEPLPDERKPTGGISLERRVQPRSTAADRKSVCTTVGVGTGLSPLSGTYQVQDFLVKGQPPKGVRRRVSTAGAARYGLLDTVGAVVLEGSDKGDAQPSKWILSWFFPGDIGAKPRSVTASAPKDTSWDVNVRQVNSSGSRALFVVRANFKSKSGYQHVLVRTKGVGIETAEIKSDLLPSSEVGFGTSRGEPITWMSGNQIVVWLTGEQPRAIASITGRAVRALGEPTKDGVPVLLSSTSWSIAKVLPIPPSDKKTVPSPHPQTVWLDGWTSIANYRRDLGKWPACGKSPKGFRVLASRYSGSANVDGTDESTQTALYDLRVNGSEVCVVNVSQFLSPLGRRPPIVSDPKVLAKLGGAVPGPVAFLRFDLLGGKAEGGDRGLLRQPVKGQPKPPPMVRKLSCTYEEKK